MNRLWLIVGWLLLASLPALAQDTPKVEVVGGYSYLRADTDPPSNAHGWYASVAGNLNRYVGLAADFSGHYGSANLNTGAGNIKVDGTAHTLLFGPRFSARRERITPFAHVLAGAVRSRTEGQFGTVAVFNEDTAFGLAVGGGVDVTLHRHVALRLIQADYLMTRFNSETQNNVRVTAGLVFRFGNR